MVFKPSVGLSLLRKGFGMQSSRKWSLLQGDSRRPCEIHRYSPDQSFKNKIGSVSTRSLAGVHNIYHTLSVMIFVGWNNKIFVVYLNDENYNPWKIKPNEY